jgi:uncharacterized protein (TIGR02172 family)
MAENMNQLIGRGRMADVYALDKTRVVKLFQPQIGRGAVEHEYQVGRLIHAAGLPAPEVFELIERDGRFGIIYQRIEGRSMLAQLSSRPWQMLKMTRQMADLHAAMHAQKIPDLPDLNQRLEWKIRNAGSLPEELRAQALDALARMQPQAQVCHNDFHPDNILITRRGPVIIDWADAAAGDPLADVARTIVMFRGGAATPDMRNARVVNSIRSTFLSIYLTRYFELRPVDQEQLQAWMPIIAAARLEENIPGEETYLLNTIRNSFASNERDAQEGEHD